MSATSVWPVLLVLALALASCRLLQAWLRPEAANERFASIDGLRGYLALFVFLHHGCVWYFYLQTGVWKVPPSHLYTHLGQSSVALFFMITGFLFFTKLLDGRRRPIDWPRLLVSRVMRLGPLYLLAMLALFAMVALLSGGQLRDAPGQLIGDGLRWLSFTILGAPDLNGLKRTGQLVAGVTWSLPYEWLFYAALPLLAVLTRTAVRPLYVLSSAAGVLFILNFLQPSSAHLLAFGGGIAAALCARSARCRAWAAGRVFSLLILALLALLIEVFPWGYGYRQVLLLSLVFCLIACGNSLFGLLTHPLSRTLGEMAYGIYLLHGLLLSLVLRLLIGVERVAQLPVLHYWLLIAGLTPLLLGICALSFRYVERPAMLSVPRLTEGLRRACQRLPGLGRRRPV